MDRSSRDRMECQILSDIDDWDLEMVLEYIKDEHRKQFSKMSDKGLAYWWDLQFNPGNIPGDLV